MKKELLKLFFPVAILALFLPNLSIAKGKESQQWFLTPRIGTAFLMNEVNSSFSAIDNDFKNNKGFSTDIALSRTFGNHFELGLNVEYYSLGSSDDSITIKDLSGYSENRQLSRFNDYGIDPNIPIEYNTKCFTPSLFVRYYIKKFISRVRDTQKFQPYIEFSAGQNFLSTELIYTDASTLSVQYSELPSVWKSAKAETDEDPYDSPEKNLQLALGTGFRYHLNGRLTLTLAAEVSRVSTEFMDGIPNLQIDEIKAGLVPRIMLGLAIPLTEGRTKENQYLH